MRTVFGVLVLGVAAILTAGVLRAAGEPPAWAYAIPPAPPAGAPAAPAQPAAPDPKPLTLPGSTLSFPFPTRFGHGWKQRSLNGNGAGDTSAVYTKSLSA